MMFSATLRHRIVVVYQEVNTNCRQQELKSFNKGVPVTSPFSIMTSVGINGSGLRLLDICCRQRPRVPIAHITSNHTMDSSSSSDGTKCRQHFHVHCPVQQLHSTLHSPEYQLQTTRVPTVDNTPMLIAQYKDTVFPRVPSVDNTPMLIAQYKKDTVLPRVPTVECRQHCNADSPAQQGHRTIPSTNCRQHCNADCPAQQGHSTPQSTNCRV